MLQKHIYIERERDRAGETDRERRPTCKGTKIHSHSVRPTEHKPVACKFRTNIMYHLPIGHRKHKETINSVML